jgi:hypothetical protein
MIFRASTSTFPSMSLGPLVISACSSVRPAAIPRRQATRRHSGIRRASSLALGCSLRVRDRRDGHSGFGLPVALNGGGFSRPSALLAPNQLQTGVLGKSGAALQFEILMFIQACYSAACSEHCFFATGGLP